MAMTCTKFASSSVAAQRSVKKHNYTLFINCLSGSVGKGALDTICGLVVVCQITGKNVHF
jgi:hypothetical protein